MANNNGNGKSLESWIWDPACSIRGAKDAPKYKDYILPLIFTKRLCDVFDDELNRIAAEVGSRKKAFQLARADHKLVRFYLPLMPDDPEQLDHGLDAPALSRADGYFIVTLPGPNGDYDRIRVTGEVAGPITPSIEKQLTERQRQMVSLLMNGEELTSRGCEARFGVTRPVIAKDFRQLLELGLAERIGKGRSTRYRARAGK